MHTNNLGQSCDGRLCTVCTKCECCSFKRNKHNGIVSHNPHEYEVVPETAQPKKPRAKAPKPGATV